MAVPDDLAAKILRRRFRIGLTLVALSPLLASVARVQQVTVDHSGMRYRIDLSMRLDATPARAYAVFTDFRNLPRINPLVREEQVTPGDTPDIETLRTRADACVVFFCRTLHQVQTVYLQPRTDGGDMRADIIPALSDFSYGVAHWSFRPCTDNTQQTCLHFRAQMEPAFWIPPLIGPWLIERKLREESVIAGEGIERLARNGESQTAQ